MAVSGAGDTAALLGLVNSLQTNQSERNAVEEDRAFQMGMAQWQRAASEEMAANQAQINFALQTIAAKNVEESLEKTTQRDLGILSSKVSSPDALGAINSLLQVSATKASTIAEQRNRATETLAGLKGVEANLRQSIDTMRGQTAQYQAGANDFTLARLVQEKLVPGVATGNMDTRNWTMNIGEVSDTLAQVAAERPELVLPYRNAEGGVDMASLRSRGLMTAIETLNKEGLESGAKLEELQIDKAKVEAQREATRAAQEDPLLREYKRLTTAATKAGQTLPEYIAEHPEEKRAYYLTLRADTDEETVDAFEQLDDRITKQLTSSGLDPKDKKFSETKTKLMRDALVAEYEKYGFSSPDEVRQVTPITGTHRTVAERAGITIPNIEKQRREISKGASKDARTRINRLARLANDYHRGPDTEKGKRAAEQLDKEFRIANADGTSTGFTDLAKANDMKRWETSRTRNPYESIDEAFSQMANEIAKTSKPKK